jgi:hypothetical protein
MMDVIMRSLLAAFDQAHLSSDRTYWTWRHPELPLRVLDAFYYDHAAMHLPSDVNPIAPTCVYGGCGSVGGEWICWYRFVDGGRDKVGRPGRCVLLAAFVKRDDHRDRDWSEVLCSAAFQEIAAAAPTKCPLPTPASLELEWDPPPVVEDASAKIKELLRIGHVRLESAIALQQLSAICGAIPTGRGLDGFFIRTNGIAQVSITVRKESIVERPVDVTVAPAVSVQISHSKLTQKLIVLRWPSMLFLAIQETWRRIVQQPAGFAAGLVVGIVVGATVSGPVNEFFRQSNRKRDTSPPLKTVQPLNAPKVQVPATDDDIEQSHC